MTKTAVQDTRAINPGIFVLTPEMPVTKAIIPNTYPIVPKTICIRWNKSTEELKTAVVAGIIPRILIVVSNKDSPAHIPCANVYFSFEIWYKRVPIASKIIAGSPRIMVMWKFGIICIFSLSFHFTLMPYFSE